MELLIGKASPELVTSHPHPHDITAINKAGWFRLRLGYASKFEGYDIYMHMLYIYMYTYI